MKLREAELSDTKEIVELLANDKLGTQREHLDNIDIYSAALAEIIADPNAYQLLGTINDKVVACAQLNFMRSLSHGAALRGQIESVRVHADYRGQKLGEKLITQCVELCRKRECQIVQLMSDKQRDDAIRFYKQQGFQATHEGFKLHLE